MPTGMETLSQLPTVQNNPIVQQPKLRTGKNPNPKFPRLRNWWEGVKEGGGNALQGAKEFTIGTPGEVEQVQNYSPAQQSIFQLLQQLGIYGLQNPYGGFEPIEQQAQAGFNQNVDSLAHRFTSLGNASLSSPAFATQLGGAAAGLQGDLAAQRAQYGQQNIGQLLQMLQLGLTPQFENIYRPGQNGLFQNALGGLANAAPSYYQSRQISNAIKDLTK